VAGLEQHTRKPARRDRPSALVYQVNNFVSSPSELTDDLMAAAGLANAAARLTTARSGQVTLEAILAAPPDLLVIAGSPTTYRTAVADNLRHPALARLITQRPHASLPWPLLLCGTHHVGRAIDALAAARDRIGGERR
jgi:iron complex transport system substrate-binding protein